MLGVSTQLTNQDCQLVGSGLGGQVVDGLLGA
jgi:hypothetical protein